MTWFRVDDTLPFHAKVVAAGNPAMGLWVRAGAWSSQQLTDGFVPAHMVPALGNARQAGQLVAAGLWDTVEGGYQFHGWTDEGRQPSREHVENKREEARERMRRVRANGARTSSEVRLTPSRPVPSPTTQPPPTSEVGGATSKPKRATRLPEDYALTEVMRAWAASETPSVDPVREFDRFRDFWRAARDGAKRDWDATWRNWMRKAQDESGGSRGSRGGGPRPSTTDQRVADAQALKAQLRPEAAQLAIGAS